MPDRACLRSAATASATALQQPAQLINPAADHNIWDMGSISMAPSGRHQCRFAFPSTTTSHSGPECNAESIQIQDPSGPRHSRMNRQPYGQSHPPDAGPPSLTTAAADVCSHGLPEDSVLVVTSLRNTKPALPAPTPGPECSTAPAPNPASQPLQGPGECFSDNGDVTGVNLSLRQPRCEMLVRADASPATEVGHPSQGTIASTARPGTCSGSGIMKGAEDHTYQSAQQCRIEELVKVQQCSDLPFHSQANQAQQVQV